MINIENTLGFTNRSFELLNQLSENNEREWYNANKGDFEDCLLTPFAKTLESISLRLQAKNMEFHGGRKTMFRMNRDVRFSKDKSPYKISISGLLSPSGTKSEQNGFVYLHLEVSGGFAAYGRYNLDAKALGPIRDRIVDEPDRFREVLAGLRNTNLDLVRDMSLKAMPRGFEQFAEHEFAAELKLKSMMVSLDLPPSVWLSGAIVDQVVDTGFKSQDFIRFVSV